MKDFLIDHRLYKFFSQQEEHLSKILDSNSFHAILSFLLSNTYDKKLNMAFELTMCLSHYAEPEFHIIKEICSSCYSDLHNFEMAATFTYPEYRSHLIHSCYVYLIGLYLIYGFGNQRQFYRSLNIEFFDQHFMRQFHNVLPYGSLSEHIPFSRRWILAALLHDVGYQTEQEMTSINRIGKSITGNEYLYKFSIPNFQDLLFIREANEIRNLLVSIPEYKRCSIHDDALQIIAHRLDHRLDSHADQTIYLSLTSVIQNSMNIGKWDHGLIGGIYLIRLFMKYFLKHLKAVCKEKPEVMKIYSLMSCYLEFTDAISACILHNFTHFQKGLFDDNRVKLRLTTVPLAVMLILSDELQIWNRDIPSIPQKKRTVSVDSEGKHVYNIQPVLWEQWDVLCIELVHTPERILNLQYPARITLPYISGNRGTQTILNVEFLNHVSPLLQLNHLDDDSIKREWDLYCKTKGSVPAILDLCLQLFAYLEKQQNRVNIVTGIPVELKDNEEKTKMLKNSIFKLQFGSEIVTSYQGEGIVDFFIGEEDQQNTMNVHANPDTLSKLTKIIGTNINNEDLISVLGFSELKSLGIDHWNQKVSTTIQKLYRFINQIS